MAEEKGVWRTVSGRRIFIAEGQSLTDAMKKSGKFSKKLTDDDMKILALREKTKTEYEKEIANLKSKGYEVNVSKINNPNEKYLLTTHRASSMNFEKDKYDYYRVSYTKPNMKTTHSYSYRIKKKEK